MYIIIAKAPTVYQLNSLRHFGLGFKENPKGGFTASGIFYTEQEAKDFLIQKAYEYYDAYEGEADEHIDYIKKSGSLSIDGAYADISEFDIDYDFLVEHGSLLSSAYEGTCFLYEYDNVEYVVLPDNTVITRKEDNDLEEPIFPYKP
jgi:hypothetical protein